MADCALNALERIEGLTKTEAAKLVGIFEELKKSTRDHTDFSVKAMELKHTLSEQLAQATVSKMENSVKANDLSLRVMGLVDEGVSPQEAIMSIIAGSPNQFRGANFSIEAKAKARANIIVSQTFHELRNSGYLGMARSGHLDGEIAEAMMRLSRQSDTSDLPKEAVEIAKVFNKGNKALLSVQQRAGIDIRHLDTYVAVQKHDPSRMMAQGKDAWKAAIRKHFDLTEENIGVVARSDAELDKWLDETYDKITSSKTDEVMLEEIFSNPKNLDKISRFGSKSRRLHAKSGQDFMAYQREFGNPGTLMDVYIGGVLRDTNKASVVETLGTNPRATYEKLKKNLRAHLEEKGDTKGLKALEKSETSAFGNIDKTFKIVTGDVTPPAENMYSKFVHFMSRLNSMSLLGSTLFASTTDFVTMAASIKSATGRNFVGSVSDGIVNYMKAIPQGDRADIARAVGVYAQTYNGSVASKFSGGDIRPGVMSSLEAKFHGLTGLSGHTERGKLATAAFVSNYYAGQANRSFDQLPDAMKSTFDRYEISSKEWDLFRQTVDDVNGTKMLTIEGLEKLGLSEKDLEPLQAKLGLMFNDIADMASPTPGARTRANLYGLDKADNFIGAVRVLAMQFKSFPVEMFRLMNRFTTDHKGDRDLVALTEIVLGGTAMAYVGMSAISLSKNEEPPDPTDWKTIRTALMRSGTAGLMGDFLLGDLDKNYRSALKDAAGPTIGMADDVVSAMHKISSGAFGNDPLNKETKRGAQKLMNTLMRRIPYQNHFLTRDLFDRYIYDAWNESMSPGYRARKRRRAIEEDRAPLFK